MTTKAMLMMTIMLTMATMVNKMLMGPLPSRSSCIQVTATLMTIMRTTMMMILMMTIRTIGDD